MNELIKVLEEILNRFPSDKCIHELECDDPTAARPCPMEGTPSYFTDKQILRYRKALKDAKEQYDLFWPPKDEFEMHIYEVRNGKTLDYIRTHAEAIKNDIPKGWQISDDGYAYGLYLNRDGKLCSTLTSKRQMEAGEVGLRPITTE